MKTEQLIKIARECGNRSTDCSCCPLDNTDDCLIVLANAMADKLEKMDGKIPVGNGENYEVVQG